MHSLSCALPRLVHVPMKLLIPIGSFMIPIGMSNYIGIMNEPIGMRSESELSLLYSERAHDQSCDLHTRLIVVKPRL